MFYGVVRSRKILFHPKESFIHIKRLKENLIGQGNEILRDELITEKTFITNVAKGDNIQITAYGWNEEPTFSLYRQSFKSRWEKRYCEPGHDNGCHNIFAYGQCEIFYRKKEKEALWTIFSEANSENYPLYLILGEKSYPLTNIKFEGSFQFINLTITDEMLQSGHDLYLNIKEGASKKIKLGFIKYGKCPTKANNFRVDAPKGSRIIDSQVTNYLRVSITLESEN